MRRIGFPNDTRIAKEMRRFEVRPADRHPALTAMRDVFVIPQMDALYTADGTRIETSKRVTVPADMPRAATTLATVERSYGVFCPPTVPIPTDYDVIDGTVLYGGLTWSHYGHFITDGMSRLWAIDAVAPDMPILFLNRDGRDFGGVPHSRLVVDSLGIADRLFDLERPTLLRDVLVPEPAIQHAFRIYHDHAHPHAEVARRVLAQTTSQFAGKPVYLSRSALKEGLRRANSETVLEEHLRKRGFTIVYPERVSMRDQIDIFNNSPLIAGLVGSAFHTELFSLRGAALRCVILCWDKFNTRYPMINAIVGSEIDYACTAHIASDDGVRISTMDIDVEASLAVIEAAMKRR